MSYEEIEAWNRWKYEQTQSRQRRRRYDYANRQARQAEQQAQQQQEQEQAQEARRYIEEIDIRIQIPEIHVDLNLGSPAQWWGELKAEWSNLNNPEGEPNKLGKPGDVLASPLDIAAWGLERYAEANDAESLVLIPALETASQVIKTEPHWAVLAIVGAITGYRGAAPTISTASAGYRQYQWRDFQDRLKELEESGLAPAIENGTEAVEDNENNIIIAPAGSALTPEEAEQLAMNLEATASTVGNLLGKDDPIEQMFGKAGRREKRHRRRRMNYASSNEK